MQGVLSIPTTALQSKQSPDTVNGPVDAAHVDGAADALASPRITALRSQSSTNCAHTNRW